MDTPADTTIRVTYRGIDTSEALTQQVTERLGAVSEKYFNRLVSCEVIFSKNGHSFDCKIRMHMGKLDIMAKGEANDIKVAYAQAEEHASKQLRRQKREIREDKPTGMPDTLEVDAPRKQPKSREDMTLDEEIRDVEANMTDYDFALRQKNSQH